MGFEGILRFDFGAQAVDELVNGMIRYAGIVFDVGIDCLGNLIFRYQLAFIGQKHFQSPSFGGGEGGRFELIKIRRDQGGVDVGGMVW